MRGGRFCSAFLCATRAFRGALVRNARVGGGENGARLCRPECALAKTFGQLYVFAHSLAELSATLLMLNAKCPTGGAYAPKAHVAAGFFESQLLI